MPAGAGVRPSVGFVIRGFTDTGGTDRVHTELIRRLSSEFHFVVVSRTLSPQLNELVTWHRVRAAGRPAAVAVPMFFAAGSLRAARLKVDLLHTCGAVVGNKAQLSTVHFCHAGYRVANGRLAPADAPLGRRVNTALMRALAIGAERWCYRPSVTGVLGAVSSNVGVELATHYPRARVVVTPNGVDIGAFAPDAGVRTATRSIRGVAPEEVVALFVGGDWDRKGLAMAIGALGVARRLGVTVRLWVVGPGDEARFARLAVEHGVGDQVDFIGVERDPSRWYRGADLVVSCSAYEAFSLALIEGAAAGVPLVTSRVGCAEELVPAGPDAVGAGVVVERRDPELFGAALAELAKNPDLRARMGAMGQHRAAAYSWDAAAAKLAGLYREILSGSPAVRRS